MLTRTRLLSSLQINLPPLTSQPFGPQTGAPLMATELVTLTDPTGATVSQVPTSIPFIADDLSVDMLSQINERLASVGLILSKL